MKANGRNDRSQGQTLVEFVIVFPVLALLLFGIIQFGFLFGGQIGLVNAAREAARYAAVLQTASSVTASTFRDETYDELTKKILPRSVAGYGDANLVTTGVGRTAVCYLSRANADGTSFSVFVRVQIQYRHPLLIPLVGNIVDGIDGTPDNAFRLGASEEMRVENPLITSAPGGLPSCPS